MKWLLIFTLPVVALAAVIVFLAREVPPVDVALPDDALAVLDDPRFAPPANWKWQRLETQGGDVRWGYSAPLEPKAVVMFLPGFSAPLEIYLESFTALNEAGYAVVAMDWPGQGGSSRGTDSPQKIHARSLDGHVGAAEDVLEQLHSLYPNRPVLLVGLSMGAQLGTRLLAARPDFEAAALITPAYGLYGDRPTAVEWAMLSVLDAVGFGARYVPGGGDWVFDLDAHNGVASACSHPNDRTKLFYAAMARDPTIKVGGMSNAFALALVRSGETAQSPGLLQQIAIPVWMPVAENDVFIDNANAELVCDRLENCRLQRYAEAKHCLFEESDDYYHPFMRDLIAFLDERLPSVSSSGDASD